MTIKHYWRLLKTLFRTSFIAEFEFRANILLKIFNDFVWYGVQISVFEVLYLHTSQISGWNIGKIRVFLGFMFLVDTVNMMFINENLEMLSERVRKGELDLVLAKPVNSQVMLSLYRLHPSYLFNFVICFFWVLHSLHQELGALSFFLVGKLLLLVVCSNITMYSMRFLVGSLVVVMGRAENLMQLWYSLFRMSTRPDFVYPPWLRYTLLSLLPLGFVASVPAHVLLGYRSDLWVLAAIVVAALMLALSAKMWKLVLGKYSSVSS
jgi:ABC-2 type transport system permease protein